VCEKAPSAGCRTGLGGHAGGVFVTVVVCSFGGHLGDSGAGGGFIDDGFVVGEGGDQGL
jgi:hypothetical protein